MISVTEKLIGMPLGCAISLLREKQIQYRVVETKSRSHFFLVQQGVFYVIRAVLEEEICVLTVCETMILQEEIQKKLEKTELCHASKNI